MMSWRGFCKGGIQIFTSGALRCAGTYSRSALRDHYQVLGVGREASSIEIKNAFFNLSKKCHPDSDPSNPLLHAQFVRINEAYKVLRKPSSRKEYDKVLEAIQRNGPAFRDQSAYKTSSRANGTTHTYRKEEPYHWSSKDNDWYWSQFSRQSDFKESEKKLQERNKTIVWTCIFLVFSSIYLHLFVFRMNGINKQKEILLQKHEERLRKLYGRDAEAKK
ncbi:unnamed protein product [Staurois parvus]|uniref:J domain-containing protein n=1 Tax=Staurois parvus TaxID=386267 RepID=A0ABN9CGL3_9NEOB|nr:unnamed protein product [Staurois parvus]